MEQGVALDFARMRSIIRESSNFSPWIASLESTCSMRTRSTAEIKPLNAVGLTDIITRDEVQIERSAGGLIAVDLGGLANIITSFRVR